MNTQTKTYGELQNGDRVYIQGHLFQVASIVRGKVENVPPVEVVRFIGFLDESDPLYNTSYNGGIYGAINELQCTVAVG